MLQPKAFHSICSHRIQELAIFWHSSSTHTRYHSKTPDQYKKLSKSPVYPKTLLFTEGYSKPNHPTDMFNHSESDYIFSKTISDHPRSEIPKENPEGDERAEDLEKRQNN
ncbi:hypothetical protein Adt_10994 [Abeliophyllum distichum]|uniref:Uncharacterized protein n=1 Tax=Abeliophyllum distichum TaxID=126358 RepID=A0ABD1ULS6_9LAMI